MITFALVCVELYLIERFLERGHRGFYAMPLIVLAWANFHGGFIIAFLFLGIAFAVEAGRWLTNRSRVEARVRAGRIALVFVASLVIGLVNPELLRGEGVQVGYEGCLSYPGWFGEVARYETVTVKALNRKGKGVRHKATGFTARAFQHEIDHLDGILFTDRLTSLGSLRRVEELEGEGEDEEAV